MNHQNFRHELKHAISSFDAVELVSRLKHVALPDTHAVNNGSYSVRSLYFDNAYDKALREKIDGISNREKFRVRFYNGDTSYIRLEKKVKSRGLCQKYSAVITKEQCERLLSGDYGFLKESEDGLFLELYAKMHTEQLRPKTIVDYTRQAYIFPAGNVRVTLDSDVRTSTQVNGFLNSELCCRGVTKAVILEIKYDSFLPQVIADLVQVKNRQAAAFSKYAACRTL